MKTLLLMRHAKSSWDNLFCSDHDRKLSRRGLKAAPLMGHWLRAQNLNPDAVLLSSATRVHQTWRLVDRALQSAASVLEEEAFYMAGPNRLLQAIQQTSRSIDVLLIINHEPTLSTLLHSLSRPPLGPGCARAFAKFPTASIAELLFDSDSWQTINTQTANFSRFTTPNDL